MRAEASAVAAAWEQVARGGAGSEVVLEALAALEAAMLAQGDRRGVFASAYRLMTAELVIRRETGFFADPGWFDRLTRGFAQYYLRALRGHEQGRVWAIPRCWRLTLEAGQRGETTVLQDLLLAMNAHINHDLPLALAESLEGRRAEQVAGDFMAIHEAVCAAVAPIQAAVGALAPGLRFLDTILRGLDDAATAAIIGRWRRRGWRRGLALAATGASAQEQPALDHEVTGWGRLILAPTRPRMSRQILRWLEQQDPIERWLRPWREKV